jgi:hypothetical protein
MGKTRGKEPIIRDVADGLASLSHNRNPFSIHCRKISKPWKIKYESSIVHKPINNVRFALISLNKPGGESSEDNLLDKPLASTKGDRIPIQLNNRWGLELESCRRSLYLSRHKEAYRYLNLYRDAIQIALEQEKANIVCVNELGISADVNGPLPRFFKQVGRLVKDNAALVITGSHHDSRTRYNTGYIFYPGCPIYGQPFHKQVSATQGDIGEYISVPAERQSKVIRAFRLNIAVITCLDIADYSTISSLVQLDDKLDFILVPSCSPRTESLEEIAKMVSGVLPGGVFIINEYRRGKKPASFAYFFGSKDPIDYYKQVTLGDNGVIDIYDIPRKWFDYEKDSAQHSVSPDSPYQWLLKNPTTN